MRGPAHIHTLSRSEGISSKVVVWLTSCKVAVWLTLAFTLVCLVMGWKSVVRQREERARAHWKTATLPRLAGLSLTNQDISRELDALKVGAGGGDRREWVSDHVLLMTNGECLIYAFRHGFNSGRMDHLFLAHGSDGRWLYSTYHFCNQMAGARFDEPPGSIAEFARTYSAREFDGKSDECLQHTWPAKK